MRKRTIKRVLALPALGLIMYALAAQATPKIRSAFLARYPDVVGTRLARCTTCHHGRPGALNLYGRDLEAARERFEAVERKDSDLDGVSNLDEIHAHTNPGDPADKPVVTGSTARSSRVGRRPDNATGE